MKACGFRSCPYGALWDDADGFWCYFHQKGRAGYFGPLEGLLRPLMGLRQNEAPPMNATGLNPAQVVSGEQVALMQLMRTLGVSVHVTKQVLNRAPLMSRPAHA